MTPEQLETVARVGRNYRVPILKITSGQRTLFAGIEPEDVPRVIADPGPLVKPGTEPCVSFVQACLGTDMCRYGKQDSIRLARAIDDTFRNQTFPAKIKIGVSGCPRCCSESHTRGIGIIATPNGWTIFSEATQAPGHGWVISLRRILHPMKRLIVLCALLNIIAVMHYPTSGQPGLWNASEQIH